MRAAVLCMDGFEEIEGLTVVDMLRRLGIGCDIIGKEQGVTGSHSIKVETDRLLADVKAEEYDAVILPGGMPGATNLRDDERVIGLVREMADKGKIVAAICAAPIVLERAGVLEDKKYTCYPGFEDKINQGKFVENIVVKAGNVITSRGPATSMEFAFAIAEAIGVDTESQREGSLWNKVYCGQ